MPKTPISYYGGKQSMLKEILPRIPEHTIYTEAFFGGGAVFFAKEPAQSETINDVNALVTNFYSVCKNQFEELKNKIEATLFARTTYTVAKTMYRMPHLFNNLQLAWAFFIATNFGFANNITSWGYDKYGVRVKSFRNKKLNFNTSIQERLENVQVECNDACKVILSRDTLDSFHYVDPPYINSNQGMYGGYSEQDYRKLLDTLSQIKGKFLLSSYPSEILDEYIEKFEWHTIQFEKPLSASKAKISEKKKRKIEVLTANYPI